MKIQHILIKNARIVTGEKGAAPAAPVDIAIKNGIIQAIGTDLSPEKGAEIWDFANAYVSPGWLDVGPQACDPGYEHREDLQTLAKAAAAGGFAAVATFPNTHPAVHSKSEVLYIKNNTAGSTVTFYPIGAISHDCAGKDLAELYDMHAAGAIAFSDGSKSVQDAGLLLRALQYAQAFNGLIINQPHHKSIAAGGQMHEGLQSTSLGLRGIPTLSETLMIQRDLSLLEYAGGRLHIHLVSSQKSVALVRAAKKAGLNVTASVAVANLCFTDEELAEFESHWKVMPPLRGEDDRKALLKAVEDGTIDFICTNHTPWDTETKNLEFTYAEFGMTSLETAFALCRTYLDKKLDINELVDKFAVRSREILGLPVPAIKAGAKAVLTVFDPEMQWTFEAEHIASKSRNTPLVGHAFKGKVLGIVNGERCEKASI